MDERERRVVENEALFREVNERVREIDEGFGGGGSPGAFCECGDAGCTQRVDVTPEEYARVRSDPRAFVVLPGHELPDVEEVVDRNERFVVVRKRGEAASLAR